MKCIGNIEKLVGDEAANRNYPSPNTCLVQFESCLNSLDLQFLYLFKFILNEFFYKNKFRGIELWYPNEQATNGWRRIYVKTVSIVWSLSQMARFASLIMNIFKKLSTFRGEDIEVILKLS